MPTTRSVPVRTLSTLALCLVLGISGAAGAQDREAPLPLTPEQVACNAGQLGSLLARMEPVEGPGSSPGGPLGGGWTLFATYADPFGAYEGLLIEPRSPMSGATGRAERHLAWVLQPSIRELLLNPARPPLDQVSLTREESASTLAPVGGAGSMALALAPTLGASPEARLVIDDAGLPTATKPGRGLALDRITSPCHYGLTDEDVWRFALLQRLLRFDLRGPSGVPGEGAWGASVALYRGTAPERIRVDLFPHAPGAGVASCRLALAIDLERTGGGKLGGAVLQEVDPVGEGLPRCEPGALEGEAFLVQATFAGAEPWSRGAASPGLPLATGGGGASEQVVADLARLLEGSRWNRPGPEPPPACRTESRAQIAASPRRDVNMELMAATLGDGLLASQALYDRMRADQSAIVTLPGRRADGFRRFSPYNNVSFLTVSLEGALRSLVPSDPRLRCLVDEYQMTARLSADGGELWLVLSQVMNLRELAARLREIPGVGEIRTGLVLPDPAPPPPCVRRGGAPGTIEYLLGLGGGHYVSTGPGVVRPIRPGEDPPAPGPWICSALDEPVVAPFAGGRSEGDSGRLFGLELGAFGGPLFVPGSQPTAEQVDCRRRQLRSLLERATVREPSGGPPEAPHTLLVASGDPAGLYDGLLVGLGLPRVRGASQEAREPAETNGEVRAAEHQLGFHLGTSVRSLLLNPERPPLDQVVLARESSTSILVSAGDRHAVSVSIDPTLSPSSGDVSSRGSGAAALEVDNLLTTAGGSAGDAADTKPGRGLTADGLTDVCDARLDDFDRRVFSVLQRTLRADLVDPATAVRYETRIGLYLDHDPKVGTEWGARTGDVFPRYGADVYLVDPETGTRLPGRLVFTVRLQRPWEDPEVFPSRLTLVFEGVEEGIPPVAGTVALHPPAFTGVEPLGAPAGSVDVETPGDAVTVEWDELVAATAWCSICPADEGTI